MPAELPDPQDHVTRAGPVEAPPGFFYAFFVFDDEFLGQHPHALAPPRVGGYTPHWVIRIFCGAAFMPLSTDWVRAFLWTTISWLGVISVGAEPQLPPEFLIPMNASQKALYDGNYLESLRQTCKLMEWLGEAKNQKLLNKAGFDHSGLKAYALSRKAAILAELNCPKHAAAAHHDARGFIKKLVGAGPLISYLQAGIEFVEADVFRPVADFGVSGFEKFSDPYRSRQALERCNTVINQHLMNDNGDVANRLRAKQHVAVARVLMCDPLDLTKAEPAEDRYTDAKLSLREALLCYEKCGNWRMLIDPDNPSQLLFKRIDDVKDKVKMNTETEVFLKGTIHMTLADWVEWRMTQAELQARQEQEDEMLGWQLNSAEEQFAEMTGFLRAQFDSGDHPLVARVQLSQAKWFLSIAKREATKKKPNMLRVRSLLEDCVFGIDKLRIGELVSPRQIMEGNFVELAGIEELLRVPELDAEQKKLLEIRRGMLREALDPDVFEKTAGKQLVDGRGCPRKGAAK
jgi:hypothetical protein